MKQRQLAGNEQKTNRCFCRMRRNRVTHGQKTRGRIRGAELRWKSSENYIEISTENRATVFTHWLSSSEVKQENKNCMTASVGVKHPCEQQFPKHSTFEGTKQYHKPERITVIEVELQGRGVERRSPSMRSTFMKLTKMSFND